MGNLSPHEMLDLHEILVFKNVCISKAVNMQSIVQDPELKGLLNQDVNTGKAQIQQIQGFLSQG